MQLSLSSSVTLKHIATALVVGALLWITLYDLGGRSLWTASDEIIHTRVVQEMAHSGSMVPTLDGRPYFNKPPLKMWLSALVVSIAGESTTTYRILDGLAGAATCLIICLLGLRITGSRMVGLFSALTLATSPIYVLGRHGIRVATQDSALILCCTIAAYLCWNLKTHSSSRKNTLPDYELILLGVIIGCAVLIKSAAGLIPLVSSALTILSDSALRRQFAVRKVALVLIPAAALPLLYYVPLALLYDQALQHAFGREVIKRAVDGFHNKQSPFFYITALLEANREGIASFMPPLYSYVALIGGTVLALFSKKARDSLTFLLIWAITPLILFSCAQSKLPWYILPALPFLALLCATTIYTVASSLESRKKHTHVSIFIGSISILAALWIASPLVAQGDWIAREILFPRRAPFFNDILVAEILKENNVRSHPIRTILITEHFSLRGEKNKKFNPEGFYLRMLREDLTTVKTTEVADLSAYTTYDIALIEEHLAPSAISSFSTVIKPFHFRTKPLVVVGLTPDGTRIIKRVLAMRD
jgi:4-amino-4-deoxy-L-arabinose transferase-like glycosyltransferase